MHHDLDKPEVSEPHVQSRKLRPNVTIFKEAPMSGLKVAGLHEQPKLTLAPPKGGPLDAQSFCIRVQHRGVRENGDKMCPLVYLCSLPRELPVFMIM